MEYRTHGTCSQAILVELNQSHVIQSVEFVGGCSGNTQGVAKLVQGMTAEAAIERMEGIRCGSKSTSCPDQLALAIEQALKEES